MTNDLNKLEFDIVLKNVSELADSDVVASEILNITPTNDIKLANKLLTQTSDALYLLASHKPSFRFDDISKILAKARVGAILHPSELLSVRQSIISLQSIKVCLANTDGCDSLKDIVDVIHSCDELANSIDNVVESDSDLKDTASEKLYHIRQAIVRANSKLKERLDALSRQSDISKYLQNNIVTIRDGRYVVPVRAEYRSSVKGLIHDVSSTGATVFIEPFAVVEANNELKTLKTEENIEIEKILIEMSSLVLHNADRLMEGQIVLTECGIIFAKAEYAKRNDAYMPILNDCGKIKLKNARHPLISSDTIVPVNIELTDKRVLLISGPNTGGKTVALKTVGLFSLMASSGMFLPANDESEISVFDNIYCDIGDAQSISQSLSTFSAHAKNLARITTSMTERSLALLDEVGDGTDPDEGAALAIAIIKRIINENTVAVITTHFNAVKEFALESDKIENACMQFDNVSLKPTYRLILGASGSSYALEIAEKCGLSSEIIADARSALSTEKIAFDKVLREAESMKNKATEELFNIEKLKEKMQEDEKVIDKIKKEYEFKLSEIKEKSRIMIKRAAAEYSDMAEEIIEQMKENLKQSNEAALFDARRAAAKLSKNIPSEHKKPKKSNKPPKLNELNNGVKVFVFGLDKEGIIVGKPRKDSVTVAIGQMKMDVAISSLSIVQEDKKSLKQDTYVAENREPVNTELMLLGSTVSEAIESIDRLISDLPPHSIIRIVHGKGTGILGKGIQAHLKKCQRIKNFRYGGYGEGDLGVTIAEIK